MQSIYPRNGLQVFVRDKACNDEIESIKNAKLPPLENDNGYHHRAVWRDLHHAQFCWKGRSFVD